RGDVHISPYLLMPRSSASVGSFQALIIPVSIQLQCGQSIYASSSCNASRISDLPARLLPSRTHIIHALTGSASPKHARYQVGTGGDVYMYSNFTDSVPWVSFSGVISPL